MKDVGGGRDEGDADGDCVRNYDQWGYGPYNVAVIDVQADQGGWVSVHFHKSFHDTDSLV